MGLELLIFCAQALLIERGYVYSAVPPLYKLTRGKQQKVAYSDEERDAISAEMRGGNPNVKVEINRFKGLGEMAVRRRSSSPLSQAERASIRRTAKIKTLLFIA